MTAGRLGRRLRMGMVGGGREAFIGAVHRMAAALDGGVEFVAGALSADPEKARESGRDLMLADERNYGTWEEMLKGESARAAGDRIDFVSIVTPNHLHFPVASAFAKAGFHVVCDKPMTHSLEEAKRLVEIVETAGIVFALTHNYTGYPMVKQARHMAREGEIGRVLKVVVEYPQGWLLTRIEAEGQKQASWRTDPKRAGVSSCMGDIGSHCENLAHYITGLEIRELCADLNAMVQGRALDDDGNVLLHFEGGAVGVLHASQISSGEENNLSIRVWGTKGALEWRQEEPNQLHFRCNEGPGRTYKRGFANLCEAAKRATRLPTGHPEAFIEAFANIYKNATDAMRARIEGRAATELEMDFPTVADGARGMAFIESTVESGRSEKKWFGMKRWRG